MYTHSKELNLLPFYKCTFPNLISEGFLEFFWLLWSVYQLYKSANFF